MMNFVLIDNTGGAKTADGSPLTPDVLNQIASAAAVYLNRDVGFYWGLPVGAQVRVGDGTDTQPGEWVFVLLPTLPNAPNAIAYHDVNGNGVPVLFDAITLSQSLLSPGNSLSVAITHELAETLGDEACNAWRDGPGASYAQELSDAVESSDYVIETDVSVSVSNFVLPAFFNPNHEGPFDKLEILSRPFETAAGGYQIVRDQGGNEHQVFARGLMARRQEKRKHWSSRSYRRGLRVAG